MSQYSTRLKSPAEPDTRSNMYDDCRRHVRIPTARLTESETFIFFFVSFSYRFTLSAVSPAVLVPSLLRLKRLGYGEDNGVNTLVIAASSLDDIVSISAFGVLLGIVFSTGTYDRLRIRYTSRIDISIDRVSSRRNNVTGDLTSKIIQGPVDICIGTALGLVWGFLLIFVPASPWAKVYRTGENETQENDETRRVNIERMYKICYTNDETCVFQRFASDCRQIFSFRLLAVITLSSQARSEKKTNTFVFRAVFSKSIIF